MRLWETHKGVALIMSMIFVLIFSALAVSLATFSAANLQVANDQHKANSVLSAAQSGLEWGKHIAATVTLGRTPYNYVTGYEADKAWTDLCQQFQTSMLGRQTVPYPKRFTDSAGTGDEIISPSINFGANAALEIRFYRYDTDAHTIKLESTGTDRNVTRKIYVDMQITKDSRVLNYAIASGGRMRLTGNSKIYGDIFSSWNHPEISPFSITSDSRVQGAINTVLNRQDIENAGYQLETLDENGYPIDINGNLLGNNYQHRYYGKKDEIQGYHEGINYKQPRMDLPGMDIADYDTQEYKHICIDENGRQQDIPPASTIKTEYFPHAPGDYSLPRDGTPSSTCNKRLYRHVYENQKFTNVRLPDNRNALFRNCTFKGVLYIDCYQSGSSKYNNVRFENCTVKGIVVTDVPREFKWKDNCLYFTGQTTFDNQSAIQEATILAPHFNVNLANINSLISDNNVLTGAIVAGTFDVRGKAQIHGTIISMCDTTQSRNTYVTNIGAACYDSSYEMTKQGNVGAISVIPRRSKMLPSGIVGPLVIRPLQDTYSEGL